MPSTGNKRFIAGAICPKCQTLDSIRTWETEQTSFQDCFKCGYKESFSKIKIPDKKNISIKLI